MTEDWQNGGFGLYLHWPFCQAKCPYCDFNSHVAREIDQEKWKQAYLQELDRYAAKVPGRILNSVFFGGGTPSLMDPDVVGAIMERIRQLWTPANNFEVTLEANPGSVESGRFRAYSEAGINRISMGVQALNDRDLQRLGRIHSVDEAYKAFDIARTHFDRVSFDLIYARQGQTLAEWQAELKQALDMAIDHLSLYQLTIEAGTAFGDRYARGKLKGLPGDDLAADMYQATREICADAGFSGYEVSNYARAGAESLHNLIYWNYGDYVGIGPGAHGRLTLGGRKFATEALRAPDRWLAGVAANAAERKPVEISRAEQADEMLMMGLRLNKGVECARFEALSGKPISRDVIDHLGSIGMVTSERGRVAVTDQGLMVLNMVITELLAG